MPRLLVDQVYVGGGSYQDQLTLGEQPIDDNIVGQVELTEEELAEYVNLTNKLQSMTENLLSRKTALKQDVAEETYYKYESYAAQFE